MTGTDAHFREMHEIHERDRWGAGSRRALVVSNALAYGMGMMFKTLSGPDHGEFRVFRNLDDALDWLHGSGAGDADASR